MTHMFIEENTPTDWGVHYGDVVIHCEEFEQAAALALKIATQLGLIGC